MNLNPYANQVSRVVFCPFHRAHVDRSRLQLTVSQHFLDVFHLSPAGDCERSGGVTQGMTTHARPLGVDGVQVAIHDFVNSASAEAVPTGAIVVRQEERAFGQKPRQLFGVYVGHDRSVSVVTQIDLASLAALAVHEQPGAAIVGSQTVIGSSGGLQLDAGRATP